MRNYFERTCEEGRVNGHDYELRRRTSDAVYVGAAPYALYVDGKFYCTCESRQQATDELEAI